MPALDCDLVMRGGITSGVVFPGLLFELARSYRLRNIGGASAGAIAAGVAAAAEYGRRSGKRPDAFETLVRQLPDEIGGARANTGGTSFATLFQAPKALEPLRRLAFEAAADRPVAAGVVRLVIGTLWPSLFPLLLTAGAAALVAAVLGFVAVGTIAGSGNWAPVALAMALLAGLVAGLLALLGLLWLDAGALRREFDRPLESLRAHGWGIAAGVNPALQGLTDEPDATTRFVTEGGFADWMHATIQRAAGRGVCDPPLTVGELWGADRGTLPDAWDPRRDIDLLLTTTNLTQQLPHQFPFLERPRSFLYFTAGGLKAVLPAPVVDFMVAKADARYRLEGGDGTVFHRLPMVPDLPLLLGVRLSMSFPGLVAAVRLFETWSWDPPAKGKEWTKAQRDARDRAVRGLAACWFSDGGITSNFPVTAFDSPLPTRPTFCVNLGTLSEEERARGKRRIVLADDNSEGIRAPRRSRLEAQGPGAFLEAVVDTARNGHENELMTMPGQRDRIVTVLLAADEGGLNLDMGSRTVRRLATLGRLAGRCLVGRYHPAGAGLGDGWTNHRWVRARTTLAAVEGLFARLDGAWTHPQPDGRTYAGVLADSLVRNPPSYSWSRAPKEPIGKAIADVTAAMRALAAADTGRPATSVLNGRRKWPRDRGSFSREGGAPQPPMAFALRPTGGRDPLKG